MLRQTAWITFVTARSSCLQSPNNMDEITGGTPHGASTPAKPDGSRAAILSFLGCLTAVLYGVDRALKILRGGPLIGLEEASDLIVV